MKNKRHKERESQYYYDDCVNDDESWYLPDVPPVNFYQPTEKWDQVGSKELPIGNRASLAFFVFLSSWLCGKHSSHSFFLPLSELEIGIPTRRPIGIRMEGNPGETIDATTDHTHTHTTGPFFSSFVCMSFSLFYFFPFCLHPSPPVSHRSRASACPVRLSQWKQRAQTLISRREGASLETWMRLSCQSSRIIRI